MTSDTISEKPNETDSQSSAYGRRLRVSKFLYVFAWAFEIVAVIVGLAIALATVMSNLQSVQATRGSTTLNFSEITNTIIAALPFIMVSMVEATKIPLTEAFYETTARSWKLTLGAAIAFVALITFESAMNGFERNYSMLMYSIQEDQKTLFTTLQNVDKSQADILDLKALRAETIDEEYNDRYNELFDRSRSQKDLVQDQINLLRGSVKTESIAALRDQLKQAQEERDSLISQRNDEVNRVTEDFAGTASNLTNEISVQRRSYQGQLARAEQQLTEMNKQAKAEVEKTFILARQGLRSEWDEKIKAQEALIVELRATLNSIGSVQGMQEIRDKEREAKEDIRALFDKRLSNVDARIRGLNADISLAIGTKEQEIEANIAKYTRQLRDLDDEFQGRLEVIQQSRTESYERLRNNQQLIDTKQIELDAYKTSQITIENAINKKVADNQIYRIATMFSEEDSPARVERSLVSTVAVVWSASLAGLIAVMGVFLCLGSLVIRDPSIKTKGEIENSVTRKRSNFGRFLKTLRWAVISTRKSKMRRKEIVEVDKVVFKEVPVEVVRKEFVHIPFYTNDKNLLNITSPEDDLQNADDDPEKN